MNVAKLFTAVALGLSEAQDITNTVEYLVNLAEESGATGPAKLAAVKAALEAYVASKYPALSSQFEAIWTEANALISGIVSIFHALGIFTKRGPAPASGSTATA